MSAGARPKVLVCDDETQILRALRVIDLVLPDVDGVELCRRLREWTQRPVIVLSAVGDEDAKVRALAAGADDYVTKPFGPRELIARLEANLRRTERHPGGVSPHRQPAAQDRAGGARRRGRPTSAPTQGWGTASPPDWPPHSVGSRSR